MAGAAARIKVDPSRLTRTERAELLGLYELAYGQVQAELTQSACSACGRGPEDYVLSEQRALRAELLLFGERLVAVRQAGEVEAAEDIVPGLEREIARLKSANATLLERIRSLEAQAISAVR